MQGPFIAFDDDAITMITKYLPWLLGFLYLVLPYDLLPDLLLGPGWLDDLGVLALAWWWANRLKKGYQTSGSQGGQARSHGGTSDAKRPAEDDLWEEDDPHKILGIEKDASKEEIKAAYKKLAAQYHPDKVQHLGKEFQELAHKKFVAIQKAYDTLTK